MRRPTRPGPRMAQFKAHTISEVTTSEKVRGIRGFWFSDFFWPLPIYANLAMTIFFLKWACIKASLERYRNQIFNGGYV